MPNTYFQFQQFRVNQERCAMKVGTDGTLLGAWAQGGQHILDIGTGTGLIALMMAQRYHEAEVTAIDIDPEAVIQARDNVNASPFAGRINVLEENINCHQGIYDSLVCNPPYFEDSLTCPDDRRTLARHAHTLTYTELMAAACRLLTEEGELSLVIPFDCRNHLEQEAALNGLFKIRECGVKTTPAKPPRRFLLAFSKHPKLMEQTTELLEDKPGHRSDWYEELTHEFYLRK